MPRDGIDELDPRFPIHHTQQAAIYWHLLRRPPVTAPWRSRVGFTVDETARAVAADAAPRVTFVRRVDDDPPAVTVPYPALTPEALARERFALPGGYLP